MGRNRWCSSKSNRVLYTARLGWIVVLLGGFGATPSGAQGVVVKNADLPATKQAESDAGKKPQKSPVVQAPKPAEANKPDAAKTGDTRPPDKPQEPDNHPPSVTPSAPSITDTATLSAPGWIEFDLTGFKNLNRDRSIGTPSLLKLTSGNRRLQYRIATDGFIRQGDHTDGVGDTYLALQYLYKPQEKAGFDLAGRLTAKVPTGRRELGGTQKFDVGALLLASRDFTKWQFHGDFNVGFSSLTRADAPGTDYQVLLAASTTTPLRGGRWQYFNELVYFSPVQGQRYRVTTMQGFTFAQHRYEVYSAAMQWQLHGDASAFQVLLSASFFAGKLF